MSAEISERSTKSLQNSAEKFSTNRSKENYVYMHIGNSVTGNKNIYLHITNAKTTMCDSTQ